MNSAGHKANILDPSFNEIGVAIAANSKGELYYPGLRQDRLSRPACPPGDVMPGPDPDGLRESMLGDPRGITTSEGRVVGPDGESALPSGDAWPDVSP